MNHPPLRALMLALGILGACSGEQLQPPATTTDAPATTTDAPDTDTGAPGECEGASGCWDCAPASHEHLLNGCTAATCEPFINTRARLPLLLEDGTLPPLP